MSGAVALTDSEDILPVVAGWLAEEGQVALATVISSWGSSPRPAGSQMAISPSGRMAGSISGGCIEAAVAEAAGITLGTGAVQTLEFGISNERAWEVGLACGGQVRIFMERVGPAHPGSGE